MLPSSPQPSPAAPESPSPREPAPAATPAPVAPPARVAPVDLLASQVAAWAEERCRRTTAHSAPLAGLLADFRRWRGGAERVGAREFEVGLATLGGVRVLGHAVVAGIVLR